MWVLPEIPLDENTVYQELTPRGLVADGDGLANLVIAPDRLGAW